MYNPWSLLEYVSNTFTPGRYWAGTSGNDIVPDLIKHADDETVKVLKLFGNGEPSVQDLDAEIALTDIRKKDPVILYSIMAMTGYLNAVPDGSMYSISIPNKEMYRVFGEATLSKLKWMSAGNLMDFADAIVEGDVKKAETHLKRMMMGMTSFRVLDSEHAYQAFLTGLLAILGGRYNVTMDREGGEGYYDLLLENRYGDGAHALIEVERVDSKRNDNPDAIADAALKQIKTRSYTEGLEGTVILYGIAFKVKSPTIHCEVVEIRST